ncbi:MAG TPA: hypothetical protein VN939_19305 [Chthoniobacterales bacterium]|jgi:hypothetical protein|nr:hypothetical protein [Chthoniobacterales bacterium]
MQPTLDKTQTAKSRTVFELGNGTLEIFHLSTSESLLFELLKDLFENHWQEIDFGILIQGAAWEIKATSKPESVTLHDGYLTVDFGAWHFHICIGENKGSPSHPTDPELKAHRRTSRAELYRQLNQSGTPNSWGLRLYNGKDEQQLTIFLPNPFLTPEMQIAKEPDWSRLALWDQLRAQWLGLSQPDPFDRSGHKFQHG